MAKQDSLLKFKGAIEDLAFFKSRDGYQARRKSGVTSERVLKDPAFKRTRENGAEFGRSGRSAKYLRNAIRPLLLNVSDRRMISRLTQSMMRVVQSDAVSARGERNVLNGDLKLLKGFEFNQEAPLEQTLFSLFSQTLDRATGAATVSIPSLKPEESLRMPEGATHIRFVGGLATVDFTSGDFAFAKVASGELALASEAIPETELNLSVTPSESLPMFLLLGTEYVQAMNSQFYGLRNGAFNTLSLIDVNIAQ